MSPLYNHDSLKDLITEVGKGVDELILFSYFLGDSPLLSSLYRELTNVPHTIYVGHSKITQHEAHSQALDVLLTHPHLNIFLLPDTHTKLWAFRRKSTWHSYTGSYNLCPNHTAQLMVRVRGSLHSPIVTSQRKKLTVNGNPNFMGLPFTQRTTFKDHD